MPDFSGRAIGCGHRLFAVPALGDNYVWLLADAAGDAIAVDPGEAAPVMDTLAREHLRLRTILLTHHHPDHIGGADELAHACHARIYAPHDARIASADCRVADGDVVQLDVPLLSFEVIAVPGHTTSHVAYTGAGVVFCGDTLFSVGCGRIFEGTPAQMLASLDRLAALPPDTWVCCGHEYTLANCAFALGIDPHNLDLASRTQEARARRDRGEASVPVRLASELACNPFLRVNAAPIIAALGENPDENSDETSVMRFAELRRRKDAFKAPSA